MAAVVMSVLSACGGAAETSPDAAVRDAAPEPTPPPGCTVVAPTACPDPPVSYAEVSPIFCDRCVTCHDGAPGASWSLADYGHVADWQQEVRGAVVTCAMPPADSGVSITDEERVKILEWIRCGVPR